MAQAPKKGGRAIRHHKTKLELDIEEATGRTLSQRQKKFAEYYMEGKYSNKQCAVMAGYAESSAAHVGRYLLDPNRYPHVSEYLAELREQRERRYGVTLMGQLARFDQLSRGAEEAGQYSAAINAEKIRSALGGLTTDRRETVNTIDQMTRDQIVQRLAELQKKYPQAAAIIDAEYEDVTDEQGPRGKLLELSADEASEEVRSDEA